MTTDRPTEIYRFGRFTLDVQQGELHRDGRRLPLQDQPLALLCLLLRRRGDLVGRDEIRRDLWPPDVHLEFSNSLNAAVSRLRDVLGDSAGNPRFIATVPRRGYRFIAPVEVEVEVEAEVEAAAAIDAEPGSPGKTDPPKTHSRPAVGIVIAVAMLLVVLIFLAVGSRHSTTPQVAGEATSPPHSGNRQAPPPSADAPFRLAVLPITTLSSEPDRDFIGDGLTEELIGRLGDLQPRRLAVIARTSVMPYKGRQVGIQTIGRDLNVDHVLEGSLRQQEDTALITVRLIRVADQTQLWQRQFERRLIDFFDLQREISEEVANSLQLELFEPPGQPQPRHETTQARAYELYLLGQYLLNQRTHEGFELALQAFGEATKLDPEFVSAHVGIAQTWLLSGIFDAVLPEEAARHAAEAIDRVVQLDPEHSEGLLARAYLRFIFQWRWQDAEADFLSVLERSPNLSTAHHGYAVFLLSQGRYDASLDALQRALDLDPNSLILRTEQCWHLFYARRFDAAAARCREALAIDPDFTHAQDNLKWVLIRAGYEDEAIAAFLRLLELEGDSPSTLARYQAAAARRGLRGMLEQTVAHRREAAARDIERVVPYDMALDAAALGDVDLAMVWLRRAVDRRETDLVFLGVDPRFDTLRHDKRFQDLLRQARLPGGAPAKSVHSP